MDAKKTGELIATLRRELNLKQCDLAELLGVTNKAISRWETGRGYPDIETLPKISEVLNVSIPELLSGERMQSVISQKEVHSDQQSKVDRFFETVCQLAGDQTRRHKKRFVLLSVLLSVVVLFFTLATFVFRVLPPFLDFYCFADDFRWSVGNFIWSVVGSDDCVVASDYTSLTYLGKTYVPLPMNGYQAVMGEKMVDECKVQGSGFLGKLFFGETLYELENIPNQELVYLQTDYDDCISEYFVLETEYDRYTQMLQEADCRYHYSVHENESLYHWDCQLDENLSAWLNAPGTTAIAQGPDISDFVDIRAFDVNHIFYYNAGSIYRSDDTYYWFPAEYPSHGYVIHPDCTWTPQYYPINGFDRELSELFSN